MTNLDYKAHDWFFITKLFSTGTADPDPGSMVAQLHAPTAAQSSMNVKYFIKYPLHLFTILSIIMDPLSIGRTWGIPA